jgi:O-antigen/teichoic acid export membrane protein
MAMIEKLLRGRTAFLRMFSGAVAIQAMLSAANFLVGLVLVRRTSDVQYGQYVLVTSAALFATSIQWSFIAPPMVIRLTQSDAAGRANLIGGLYRDQRRLAPLLPLAAVIVSLGLYSSGRLDLRVALLLLVASLTVMTAMQRDFLRSVLFAYRRPNDVLRADTTYCALLLIGAYAATFSPLPAATAALSLTLACVVGSVLLSKAIWRHEPWNPHAPLGMLRQIAPLGALSACGSAVHLLYSQGYNYLVAGTLDIATVAGLAATRLLVMPVNLMSTGVGTIMLPTVSRWLQNLPPAKVFRRLALVSTGLAVLACCYLAFMWIIKDWLFAHVLKKKFAHADALLALWSTIAIVMIFRDQLLHYLVARARFHLTSSMTAVSAVVAISGSLVAMRHVGAPGALLGLLAGELVTVVGIVFFSIRDAYQPRVAAAAIASVPAAQLEE